MSHRLLSAALFVLGMIALDPALAEEAAPTPIEQRVNDLDRRLSLQEQSQMVVYTPPPANGAACECEPTSGWRFDATVIPTQLQLTRAQFGTVDDDHGAAVRLGLGYELENGVGMRAKLWAFGEDASPPAGDIEVGAGLFDLDTYKRFHIGDTELVIGAGSRFAHLDFHIPDLDTRSEFHGGGLGVFGEWYQPLYADPKNELAFIGHGRLSMVRGRWEDDTGFVVLPTHNDTMSIFEAAFGLEYRRRFGFQNDHYWFIFAEPQIQQWDSGWMDANLASSVGFVGTEIGLGVAW